MPGIPNYGISELDLIDWILDGIESGKSMTASHYELRAAGFKCSERRFATEWKRCGGEVRAYYRE